MIRASRKAEVLVTSVMAGSLLFGTAGLSAATVGGNGGTAGAKGPAPTALAKEPLTAAQTQAMRDLRVLLDRVADLAMAVEEAPGGMLSEAELVKHATAIDSAVKTARKSAEAAQGPNATTQGRERRDDTPPGQEQGQEQGQGQGQQQGQGQNAGQGQGQGQVTVPPQAADQGNQNNQGMKPPQAAGQGETATPPYAQTMPTDVSTDPLDELQRAIDDLLDAVAAGDAEAAAAALPRIGDAILELLNALIGPLPGMDLPMTPPMLPLPDEASTVAVEASALAARTPAPKPNPEKPGTEKPGAADKPGTEKPGAQDQQGAQKPGAQKPGAQKPSAKPSAPNQNANQPGAMRPGQKPAAKPAAPKPFTTAATPLSAADATDDAVAPMPLPRPVDATSDQG
ncbi:hypothetical protein [Streptomyces sp. NPDC005970]|uniref:hypothetical protein n=1 Tax=Streptomyces sp. NPDC005970 TaxID=3156723 RepID=UPI0033D9BFF4